MGHHQSNFTPYVANIERVVYSVVGRNNLFIYRKMDSPVYRDERQIYVKMRKFVNSKWKPLSHYQLATFIKFMRKELVDGRECKMAAKSTVDSIL